MFLCDVYDKRSVPLRLEGKLTQIRSSLCVAIVTMTNRMTDTIVIIIIKRGFDYLLAPTDCSSCGMVGYQWDALRDIWAMHSIEG